MAIAKVWLRSNLEANEPNLSFYACEVSGLLMATAFLDVRLE